MVKYRFARDSKNNSIDILSHTKDSNESRMLFCFACDREMVAKQGSKRDWHFAHKHDVHSGSCSRETYLHNAAKTILYENLRQRISQNSKYLFKFPRPVVCAKCHFPFGSYEDCELSIELSSFDLLSVFKKVTMETQVAGFRPDICLASADTRLFIEIAVSHKAEKEKIESGYRIIEIEIQSEQDFEHLKTETLDPNILHINRYNFGTKPVRQTIRPQECTKGNARRFILYRSGKAVIIPEISYFEVGQLPDSAVYIADIPNEMPESEAFIMHLSKAFRYGLKITNCHFCRYHGYENKFGFQSHKVFCKYYKRPVANTNEAASCEIYKVDEKTFFTNQFNHELEP